MPSVLYKKRKLGRVFLVWFQNSNSFVQFEEPAWFVLRRTAKRHKSETIAKELSSVYGFQFDESYSFVKEVRQSIGKVNTASDELATGTGISDEFENFHYESFSGHNYQFGKKSISFSYHTPWLENYLHPLIRHFEAVNGVRESDSFELFTVDNKVVLRVNGKVEGCWSTDESHLVKGLVFMFLINRIYDKTNEDWLMTVHASAITNGQKAILFSAPPGMGKTTMAGLLQAEGFRLISDDFVPIARNSFCAYPFPMAMSVKTGAVGVLSPAFPELEGLPQNTISPEKVVRYLTPINGFEGANNVFPVNEFIFIEYNPSVEFSFEKLDPIEGIRLLLDQAWILPGAENAQRFLDVIPEKAFYKLTYSNNKKAIGEIVKLFSHD